MDKTSRWQPRAEKNGMLQRLSRGIPMSETYSVSKKNRVRQLANKARYDAEDVFAILDAGIVAHVAFVQDGAPIVVPMIYGRDGDTIYLHGARKARVIRLLEQTGQACLNVTLLDGIVLARSAFNSSMNYRSVTVFGRPSIVDDHEAKLEAMKCISEHSMPGRWAELRDSHEKEVKMTGVIALRIDTASAKVSSGLPDDEPEDYDIAVWAGVLPVTTTIGELVDDERLLPGATPSDAVKALQGKTL
jgi:nitroimidazol reductase NimA-like FMN-containing flavoprotein (pyridoxamine 5'-phosphate oxidase superfamily)